MGRVARHQRSLTEVTDARQSLPRHTCRRALRGNGCPCRPRQRAWKDPLLVPRPADRNAVERRRLDHGPGRKPAGPARDARRPGHADIRLRQHDRVPRSGPRASRPSSAPATSPRASSSGCTFARRAGRRSPRSSSSPPGRRRPRRAALQAEQAALSLPRHAELRRLGHGDGPRHGRQPPRAEAARGLFCRPDLRLRREHDLPALAGQGPDRHRRVEAASSATRSSSGSAPRRVPRSARSSRRRRTTSATASRLPSRNEAKADAWHSAARGARHPRVTKALRSSIETRGRYDHESSPFHAARRGPRPRSIPSSGSPRAGSRCRAP